MTMMKNTMKINDVDGMRQSEKASGFTALKLMEKAGRAAAQYLRENISLKSRICVLAGCGNNGGDGLVIARLLSKDHTVSAVLADGQPKTAEAMRNLKKLDPSLIRKNARQAIAKADVIIDTVYGYSYHGNLKREIASLFDLINDQNKTVYAIDINSGCEADTGYCDPHALHSSVTLALDCFKPFHMLAKEHQMFEQCICLDLGLGKNDSSRFLTMDEDRFFSLFPKKRTSDYKGTYGKTLIIGGCFGMAGAVSLNLYGAKTVGAPYISCALPEEIYTVVAAQHVTPVFHPFSPATALQVIEPLIADAKAIAFGSGCACMEKKNDILDCILQNSSAPIILDAEAIRLLDHNTWVLHFSHAPIILTPHLGEFADLIQQSIAYVQEHKIECAVQFARDNHVTVVLKGPNTIAAFPSGKIYINQSGNQALAQAGSGDLLTGILAGILTFVPSVEDAVSMGIWLHGYLADEGLHTYSKQNFPLLKYPEIMDAVFQKHEY